MLKTRPCDKCDKELVMAQHEGTGNWGPYSVSSLQEVRAPAEVRYRIEDDGTTTWAIRAKVGEEGMLSHFADCPEAQSFRGKRRKKRS